MMDRVLNLDYRASARLRLSPENRILWRLNAFLAHSGDSWFWLMALFVIWLLPGKEWHNRSALMAAGVVALALTVFGIKLIFKRSRPPGDWGAIYRNTDPHSFPSGHAARAVMLAVLALGLGPGWFGVLVVLWMPLVSLARVAMGVHYLSDVLAGMLLGLAAGLLTLRLSPLLMAWFPFVFRF